MSSLVHLGCFLDHPDPNRVFPSFLGSFWSDNSPSTCGGRCLERGYTYSAVQYSGQCFCSHAAPPEAERAASEAECGMTCPGDAGLKCGDSYRMNVYVTGGAYYNVELSSISHSKPIAPWRLLGLTDLKGHLTVR